MMRMMVKGEGTICRLISKLWFTLGGLYIDVFQFQDRHTSFARRLSFEEPNGPLTLRGKFQAQ